MRAYYSMSQNFLTFNTSHDGFFWCLVCQMPNIWHLAHLMIMLLELTLGEWNLFLL